MVQEGLINPRGARDTYIPLMGLIGQRVEGFGVGRIPQRWAIFTIFQ